MKVTVKRKFRVNGKEYTSIEEIPPELRSAVERAMARRRSAAIRWLLTVGLLTVAAAILVSRWPLLFH